MRTLLRKAKAKAIRFKKAHRPILIMALRRGGSTMVADAIAHNRGVWFTDEPYAILKTHINFEVKSKWLRPVQHSHYFDLDADTLAEFSRYTHALLSTQIKDLGTSRRALPGLVAHRVAAKVLNAPWMIEWLAQETDAHILPMIRHPVAYALSIQRQGWGLPVEAYADRPDALQRYFTGDQIEDVARVLRDGDQLEKLVLDWIVTSAPLRAFEGGAPLTLYEDVVTNPDHFVQTRLAGEFGLPEIAAMTTSFRKPSGSSTMSTEETNREIASGNAEQLINRWKTKIDADQGIRVGAMLDRYGVTEYTV